MPGSGPNDCKIYVGDLDSNASKQELEDIFSYYGRLRNVWVARNPPGFAFVEFEDSRDAQDAIRGLEGRNICGRRARVEISSGRSRTNNRSRDSRGPPQRRGRMFNPADKCYQCGERGHYARDCNRNSYSSRRNSRSRSRSPRRKSYSRSRSRDRSNRSRSRSRGARSVSRDRSRSFSRDHSRTRERSPSRAHSRSRSISKPREERGRSRENS